MIVSQTYQNQYQIPNELVKHCENNGKKIMIFEKENQ